jgi:bacillithiol biosynthesis cysteine-adding enzyme BshC
MEIQKSLIPLEEITGFSSLLKAYLSGKKELTPFFDYSPDVEGFSKAVKAADYSALNRAVLSDTIKEQYRSASISAGERTAENIELLKDKSTFTVCTGHQLCLFTGPLYFIYKIISTINLAEQLKKQFPEHHFVPVYWMASEDHDFAEINHVQVYGKKIEWETAAALNGVESMPCGKIATASLTPVLEELKTILGTGAQAQLVMDMLTQAYVKQDNLAKATSVLVNALFGSYGLIALDASDKNLKKNFIPVMKDELLHQPSMPLVMQGIKALSEAGYEAQVNPRDINLFYMRDNLRCRIEKLPAKEEYRLVNTTTRFTTTELLEELDKYPERFSPNVVLRPVYQQQILPNLAYVGGPCELAYWLEYKQLFAHFHTFFPLLMPRNFVMWVEESVNTKMKKLGQTVSSLSNGLADIERKYAQEHAGQKMSLDEESEKIRLLYADVVAAATAADATLKALAEAELQKTLNGIKNLESKMMRSEKQKQETALNQIRTLKEKLFPGNDLQERVDNFMALYLKHGNLFIETLKKELNPFEQQMIVFTEN